MRSFVLASKIGFGRPIRSPLPQYSGHSARASEALSTSSPSQTRPSSWCTTLGPNDDLLVGDVEGDSSKEIATLDLAMTSPGMTYFIYKLFEA